MLFRSSLRVRVGRSACEQSVWGSDSAVMCLVGRGVMRSHVVAVSVGVRVGSLSVAMSLDEGSVSVGRRGNVVSSGSLSVSVWGSDLGLGVYSLGVRVGSTSCERSGWESDTSARCLAGSGVMGSLRTAVSVVGQVGSLSVAYSADVGALSAVLRMNVGATGSMS